MQDPIVIVGAARTPMGSFQSDFASLAAHDLGGVAIAAALARAGVNPETFVQVLSVGGGWGAALDRIKPFVTSGDSSNLRFSVSNALKDLTYYNQMATDTHAHHDIAQAVQATLEWACQQGDPNAFMPELIGYLAEKS